MNYSDFIEFVIVNKLQYDYGSKKLIEPKLTSPAYAPVSDNIQIVYTHILRNVSVHLLDKMYSFSFEEFFQLNKDIKVMDEAQFILTYGRDLWSLSTPLPTEIKIEIENYESKTV